MAASPSLVLHLGAHKTATSLLQKYMQSRPAEMQRVRAVAVRRGASNDLIGWGGVPGRRPELLREAVLAAGRRPYRIAGKYALPSGLAAFAGLTPRTVVVSHENSLGRPFRGTGRPLYPHAATCAQGLAGSVGDLTSRVVYYIRSQDEFLESYYLQTIHQGGTDRFRDWLAGVDTAQVSWVPVVDGLVAAFGAERVVVRDFAEIRQGQNEFIASFLRTCDPRIEPRVDFPARKNRSISQHGLDVALAMNPLLANWEERHLARVFLQNHFNNTTGPRPVLLDEDEKATIRERYAAENADLVARFRPPAHPAR